MPLIAFEKCTKCGKHTVLHGHHFTDPDDKYGWIGEKCAECGYEYRNEKETAEMIEFCKKKRESAEKKDF